MQKNEEQKENFEVIIIGGSFAGLAAAMTLGRSLRKILVIDSGQPCNAQTPHSHNFLTRDGETPAQISSIAREQVLAYPTIKIINELATKVEKINGKFEVTMSNGKIVPAHKLILATGVKDIFPPIKGFAECWGISVLHCPYCHGYEVSNQALGIISNGEMAFDFCKLISNWTNDLTLFTNGVSTLSENETAHLVHKNIKIVTSEIAELQHENGQLKGILFNNGSLHPINALFGRGTFEQSPIIKELNCKLNEQGHVLVNNMQQTSIDGIYAAGDCTMMMRSVSLAVSTGNMAGVVVNKDLTEVDFHRLDT